MRVTQAMVDAAERAIREKGPFDYVRTALTAALAAVPEREAVDVYEMAAAIEEYDVCPDDPHQLRQCARDAPSDNVDCARYVCKRLGIPVTDDDGSDGSDESEVPR